MTYHGCLLENARKQIPGQMGEIMTAKDERSLQPLRARLEEMEREGVKLYVSGTLATSEYIVRHCINEDTIKFIGSNSLLQHACGRRGIAQDGQPPGTMRIFRCSGRHKML